MKKILLSMFMVLALAHPAMCADEWLKTRAQSTDQKVDWPAAIQANNAAVDRLVGNYREGMTLTYSSATTIAVSAGEVVCSNSGATIRKFRQNTSSTNVTFSDIDTGAEASATTYYIYANCDADATTATFKISASSTAPTGVTYYKRIGTFYNNSSSDIAISEIVNDNNYYGAKLGAWSSKSFDVAYQATTDGFAILYTTGGGDRDQYILSDSSSSPSTVRCRFNTYPDGSESNSCGTPVKKGDYYKATYSGGTGSPTVYFIPLGN